MKPIFILLSLILIIFTILPQAFAYYPKQDDEYITDEAKILEGPDRVCIDAMLEHLEETNEIEAMVTTIESIEEYETGAKNLKEFAHGLIEEWGIGGRDGRGILILFENETKGLHIALQGYLPRFRILIDYIIQEHIREHFQEREYSQGLHEGTRAIVAQFSKAQHPWPLYFRWHIILGSIILLFVIAGYSIIGKGKQGWGWKFYCGTYRFLTFPLRRLGKNPHPENQVFGHGAIGSW